MGGSASGLSVRLYSASDPEYEEAFLKKQRHRCDDRVEDFCLVLSGGWGQLHENIPRAWQLMNACVQSQEG